MLPGGAELVSDALDLHVLGRLDGQLAGRQLDFGSPKQQLVLVVLLRHAGQAVSVDRLADALWGDTPPASATANIHLHVHRIRRALGPGRLQTARRRGYVLDVAPEEVDAWRFLTRMPDIRHALERGDLARASRLNREALAEWRGPAYADFADHPALRDAAAYLAELRLEAIEQQVDIDLALRDHAHLIGRLRLLLADHPYRERFHEQLVLALYRTGRSAEALEQCRDTRRLFAEDLGLDPGARLRELEKRILDGDEDPDL
ncbi:BTAD domain-containing putative transcriptional regulator [Streptomyces sp. NBC_00207]|uniref:AfsR/SARP family transcriptional regulator n=1 Tax=unclassified Streptomyces TaxID=2593676 RepID=UPI0028872A46|nr:AfsR/SARP family transcriptional regulator [Streptomyces sp. DSM 41633]